MVLSQPTPHTETDDHGLIRAHAAGDRAAFDVLVARHKDRLFNLCFWFLGDFHEAEDVCQEVFIKIYQSIPKFRFEASFATWSYRIAVNACKNRLRSLAYRLKKVTRRLDAGAVLPKGEGQRGPADDEVDTAAAAAAISRPDVRLEARERVEAVRRAIRTLDADKRSVLVLRDMEGLSYAEIAEITALPVGTVKSRLARARDELKNKLTDFLSNGLPNG